MPRTVWEVDARYKDNPQWNNASYLRACAEEAHYEAEKRHFITPLTINPALPTDAARQIDFRDIFNRPRARRLDQLTPDDCRLFCWKDCAIYSLTAPNDRLVLLDTIYRQWFPHRAEEKDVSDGSFFGKFMTFARDAATTLEEIRCFHEALCAKLKELEKEIPDTLPIDPRQARAWEATSRTAEYKLRESFLVVLLVVDNSWQKQGVLIVWKSENNAIEHGCKEGREILKYKGSDGDDLGQTRVFRCSLKRAMQLVISTNSERAQRRAEYNELFEEIFVVEDTEGDG
ncbi:MAG: hypothetical protein Q9165_000778 [Trypethelium subeluteriae]